MDPDEMAHYEFNFYYPNEQTFGTDRFGQTVQTQIRVFTVCYSIQTILTKHP